MTDLFEGIPRGAEGGTPDAPVNIFTLETACLMASEVSYNCYLLEYDLSYEEYWDVES